MASDFSSFEADIQFKNFLDGMDSALSIADSRTICDFPMPKVPYTVRGMFALSKNLICRFKFPIRIFFIYRIYAHVAAIYVARYKI